MAEKTTEKKHYYPTFEVGERVIVPIMPQLGVGTVQGQYEGDPALLRVNFDNGYKALVLTDEIARADE